MSPTITSVLKPKEGQITVSQEDLRVMSTSLDPRRVINALNKFRFIARTEVLHHRFTEKNGLLFLMTCLKRYMWNPGVCKEACFLIAGFSAQHSSHATLINEGVVDSLVALACTHAKLAVCNSTEVDILVNVLEALANFTANEDTDIRASIREGGAERLSALLNDIVLKENLSLAEDERIVRAIGMRLRRNLEYLCGCDKWSGKGKRNQNHYLSQEVYMLTKRGDPRWKLPK